MAVDTAIGADPTVTRPFAELDVEAYAARADAAGRTFVQDVIAEREVIRAGCDLSEQNGSVPVESVQAMTRAGVFRALTPMQYGGLEMAPALFFEGVQKIAAADASAAWIGGQLNVHSFEIALMDKRMQDEFWADGPDTRASSSYAATGAWEQVDGGYRLNGTWAFSSGIDHAQWIIVGGEDRNFVVPKADGVVDMDSWDVSGLKGTGSRSFTLTNVFVPDHRTSLLWDRYLNQNPGWEVNDRPLYRISLGAIQNSTMANPAIGSTLGALVSFIEQSKVRRTRRGTGVSVTENPHLLVKLAASLSTAQMVRDRQLDNWRRLFDIALEGREATPLERMKVRFDSADALASCFDVIHSIWPVAGAMSILSSNPLQRVYRDLMAMRVHGAAGYENAAQMYAKALLGLPGPSFEDNPTMRTLAWHR